MPVIPLFTICWAMSGRTKNASGTQLNCMTPENSFWSDLPRRKGATCPSQIPQWIQTEGYTAFLYRNRKSCAPAGLGYPCHVLADIWKNFVVRNRSVVSGSVIEI